MNIVLMVHRFRPDFGGVEVTAEILARGFVERHGAEVVVVTHTRHAGSDREFPFVVLREPGPLALFRAIRGADVVFHNNPCLQFYWPQLLVRRPWLVALRTWITMPGEKLGLLQRAKYRAKYALVERADHLVSNSHALAGHVRGKVEVIHNSYRDDVFGISNPAPRPRDSVVYLGRLSADKGIDLLLGALALLRERGRNLRLTLVGDGDYRPDIERLIDELGLRDAVTLVGPKKGKDIADELNRHAIAVVPSRIPEPFGTVALEAAASGCVTVVARHGGLPEAIGEAGPTFSPNDAASLAAELERLHDDDAYFESFLAAMPGHVGRHREHVMVDRFYAALESAIRKARA
ncbi:glycosyltransferase family 4 protein [Sinomonas sp. JGH33]|uniref:D-inositol 3-phosphate glycosyltransferase n=1 Tax=Sinomonas terricola TaxID=3110330 RepID=A0ABU5T165_9MICC|nr:glycosyltransferase family 4 protein [Sinomonas sp. JGH33]MEA5453403.1 glycosyltransferase family 4 protein [Sinomonas sp. JGH33]